MSQAMSRSRSIRRHVEQVRGTLRHSVGQARPGRPGGRSTTPSRPGLRSIRAMAATERQKDGQPPPAQRPPRSGAWQVARIMGVPIYLTPSWMLLAAILIIGYGPYAGRRPLEGRRLPARLQHRGLPAGLRAAARTGPCGRGTAVPRRRPRDHAGTARRLHRDGQRGADTPRRGSDRAGRPGGLVRARARRGRVRAGDHRGTVVGDLVFQLAATNALVAVFNVLPGLPLDGGRALRAGVWGLTHAGTAPTPSQAGPVARSPRDARGRHRALHDHTGSHVHRRDPWC